MKQMDTSDVEDLLGDVVDVVGDVEAFHAKFGLTYDGRPRVLDEEFSRFRRDFMGEELREYIDAAECAARWLPLIGTQNNSTADAMVAEQLEQMLDALVDLVYVAVGTAEMHGFNFREAWRRVQAANMKKERASSAEASKRGHANDVIKPPNWKAPSHIDLVINHAHRVPPP